MTDLERIFAPFSDDQVAALNAAQHAGAIHPFTCGTCRDRLGTRFIREDDGTLRPETDDDCDALSLTLAQLRTLDGDDLAYMEATAKRIVVEDRLLVATTDGWVCPTCDYTQNWAFTVMTEPWAGTPLSERLRAGRPPS